MHRATRSVAAVLGLLSACHPARESDPIVTRPIDRSIVRAAAAFREVCPKRCGVVGVYEDESVFLAQTEIVTIGVSKIRFSRVALERTRKEYGEDAPLGIIAHEFGHHLDYLVNGPPEFVWTGEYHADRWAGCLIGTLDANVEPVRAFLRDAAASMTEDHPPGEPRAAEVLAGYLACRP